MSLQLLQLQQQKGNTQEQIVALNTAQSPSGQPRRIPYWIMKGVEFGYIEPGWTIVNYLRNTTQPSEKQIAAGIIPEGFENVITWGRQGVKKSNLNRQLMYSMLWREGSNPRDIWRIVLDYMLMTKEQIYKMYRLTTDEQIKLPVVCIDDITTTIPKQLFFLGMQEFIRFQQFVATVRLRFAVVMCNSPLPQNVISVLKDNVSMEVIVFPNGSFMVERYMWLPDDKRPVTAFFKKIAIQHNSWNPFDEPLWVYEEYKERRWTITEEIVKKLQQEDSEPKYVLPPVTMQEMESVIRVCSVCKCLSGNPESCTCGLHPHAGIKIGNEKLRNILARAYDLMAEKAKTVKATNREEVAQVFS